jgi:hypothetical protein
MPLDMLNSFIVLSQVAANAVQNAAHFAVFIGICSKLQF